jgi:DNA-nicking Smr family endonuclease
MGGKPKGTGGLSPEDKDLWRHVTRDAQPLKKRAQPREETPEPEAGAKETEPAKAKPKAASARAAPAAPGRPAPPPEPALSHGTIAGVDRRSAERLKRGKLPIEAKLDLHGHTQAEAHRELDAFLARAQGAGKRCVLIVTGKGTTKETGGVLRAQVPRWLNEPANRARVLAFAHAQPQHGGHGALYVLLRRQRGD